MMSAEIPCRNGSHRVMQVIRMASKIKHNKTEEGLLIHYEVSDNETVISQINAGE
jgi:hypothetical protein